MLMDNQRVIILLLGIIILLLVACIVMMSFMAHEDSNIEFSDESLYAGDSLSVKLTDDSGKPICNETIKIKLTNNNDGSVITKDVTTNSKGNANLKLEKSGSYDVEIAFKGNSKYSSSSAAGTVDVKKPTTESVSQEQTSNAKHDSKFASDGSIYPEYGPAVDNQGITREYAIEHDMHYIEMTVDGDRPGEYETVGGYVAYDPKAGCYHT